MSTREEAVAFEADPRLDYDPESAGALRRQLEQLLSRIGVAGRSALSNLISPGDTVLIKPNLVLERVRDPLSALTSGRVVAVLAELALEALQGRGRVVIADVPLQSADFEAVMRLSGLGEQVDRLRRGGAAIDLLDLRRERLLIADGMHRGLLPLPGDPLGYAVVNLGAASELEPLGADRSRFAVGDYDRDSTAKYHMSSERNEYLIPRTVLAADVVINVPKMKTHKKSGITCALKNLVGICGHKSYLPHFRTGLPRDGGDEFAVDHPIKVLQRDVVDRLKSGNATLYRVVRTLGRAIMRVALAREDPDLQSVLAGSWYGNDTLWRTILDLNKILRYADASGAMTTAAQRRYLCVVDGVYSGEGDGPFSASTRHDGVLVVGRNPVLVDLVVCLLMGIDPEAVPQVSRGLEVAQFPLVREGRQTYVDRLHEYVLTGAWPLPNYRYRLAPGWEGHVRRLEQSRWGTAAGSGPGHGA